MEGRDEQQCVSPLLPAPAARSPAGMNCMYLLGAIPAAHSPARMNCTSWEPKAVCLPVVYLVIENIEVINTSVSQAW